MNDLNSNVCGGENRVIQNPDNGKRVIMSSVLLLCSVVLFLLSLLFDCVYLEGEKPLTPGWSLLMTGWLGIIYGYITWLANPLVFVGWIVLLKKDFELALLLSIGAVLIMLSFLFYKSIITSEYPAYSRIVGYGIGYWLWVSSAGCLVAASVCGLLKRPIDESTLDIGDKSFIRVIDDYHFDVFELLIKGYEIFRKHIYEYIMFSFVVAVVMVLTMLLYYSNKSNNMVWVLMAIVYLFFLFPLFTGYMFAAFSDISGRAFKRSEFLNGFNCVFPLFFINAAIMFMLFLLCLFFLVPVLYIGGFVLDGLMGIKGGYVLLIIMLMFLVPCFLILTPYVFAFPIVIESDLFFLKAMAISRQAYSKYSFSVLRFILLLIGINLIGVLFLGFGLLVTMPVTACAFAVAYCSVIGAHRTFDVNSEIVINL